MTKEILGALKLMADAKSIPLDDLIATIEEAVTQAAIRKLDRENLTAKFNLDSAEFDLYEALEVIEEKGDNKTTIGLEEAQKVEPEIELGALLKRKIVLKELGRIAAQSVRQMIHKKGIEGERQRMTDTYQARIGEMVTGEMIRNSEGGYIFSLSNVEAILPPNEQLQNDKFERGRRVKLAIADISTIRNEPLVIVSRVHPGLLKGLIELEVPEINEGIVEIISVVRDKAGKSKVVVKSRKHDIDAVGACVGIRGTRIQPVVKELNGEKIDIINWTDDAAKYIASALTPAKGLKVIVNEEEKTADVIAPESDLSLAIGKKGVNIKLALKLTGWRLDVMSQKEYDEKQSRIKNIRDKEEKREEKKEEKEEE